MVKDKGLDIVRVIRETLQLIVKDVVLPETTIVKDPWKPYFRLTDK